jgi:NADPH-dependent glutamate synthase beta subunit-like oxidoreductase
MNRFDRVSKKPFMIACNKVVLANGGSDLANQLGVKGENKSLSWLKYDLPTLEVAVANDEKKSKPVLIVGAGLSAADAIIACRNAGVEVVHVYRGVAAGFVSTHVCKYVKNIEFGFIFIFFILIEFHQKRKKRYLKEFTLE